MTKNLIDKQVDIYQYPDTFDSNLGDITIGDLHGNAVKLLHFLLRHQVVKFNNDQDGPALFQAFVDLYEKSYEVSLCYLDMKPIQNRIQMNAKIHQEAQQRQAQLNALEARSEAEENELTLLNDSAKVRGSILYKEQLLNNQVTALEEQINKLRALEMDLGDIKTQLDAILAQLEVDLSNTVVRLIGDELADRGSNDYLTLRLLGFLHDHQVKVNITISNHSNEFIRAYEALDYQNPEGAIEGADRHSFAGLKLLLDNNVVSKEEVNQLVNDAYKPSLKIMDYTLSDNGITLFSHAPIRFDRIKFIAKHMEVVYDDSTKEALGATIDKINTRFERIVKLNKVHEFCATAGVDVGHMTPEQVARLPLVDIIWNRWNEGKDTEDARPTQVNNYSIVYVHGHDPYQSQWGHVLNMDTALGKGMRSGQNKKLERARQQVADQVDNWQEAQQYINDIDEYKILDSNERGLGQKHSLKLVHEEYRQSLQMSPGLRTGLITGALGGIGLGLGVALGLALVATGVFAPFGAGLLGMAALAAISGGGAAIIASVVGFGIAKASAPTPIKSTVISTHTDGVSNQQVDSLTHLRELGGRVPSLDNELPQSEKKTEVTIEQKLPPIEPDKEEGMEFDDANASHQIAAC